MEGLWRLWKPSASHLRASQIRIFREQRLLALPSRGTSREGAPSRRSSKRGRQREALASVYVHLGVMVVVVGLMPQFSHGLPALLSEPRFFASAKIVRGGDQSRI